MRRLSARGSGSGRKPAAPIFAATVEEARKRLEAGGAGIVRFSAVPPDLERLRDLPAAVAFELPYREDLVPLCRDLRPRLRLRLACRGFPSLDAARAALLALSRDGIPSAVEDVGALSPEEAAALLDLFLHEPSAAAPIEPFAALLSSAVRKRPLGLWDILPGLAPGSPRPVGALDGDSGPTSDDVGAEEFLLALPREHPECLACACFPACEAYGAWTGSCATWKAVIEGIARAAREIRGLGQAGEGRG
jgi:hypothetical protein